MICSFFAIMDGVEEHYELNISVAIRFFGEFLPIEKWVGNRPSRQHVFSEPNRQNSRSYIGFPRIRPLDPLW
jgi:hypothetical protein